MNDLLEEATAALRRETARSSDDGSSTLARIERTLAADRIVDDAARLLREHEAEDRDDPAPTLRRIERSLEVRKLRDRYGWAIAAAALMALFVAAPTVWAWSAGLFEAWTAPPAPTVAPAPTIPEPPIEPAPEPMEVTLAPPLVIPPAPVEEIAPAPRARRVREVVRDEAEDVREELLFESAHRAHLGGGDRESALRAWDGYLAAYPGGRYAPEARYNRALTLVRLGRHGEARAALSPFASGAHGDYRRQEATSLIDAIDARSSVRE